MAIRLKPHGYQKVAATKVYRYTAFGLFLDMGLGKTVSTLLAVDRLINEFKVQRVLVVAPPAVVVDTWSDEAQKWEQTQHLRVQPVVGDAKQRKACLQQMADVYIISSALLEWLLQEESIMSWRFDMLVVDEASQFKNHKSKRFENLLRIRSRSKRCVLLTGTPAPNGLLDIWALIMLLDGGKRLGKNFYHYRAKFFQPAARDGHQIFSWYLPQEMEPLIHEKIRDITVSMTKEDYLDMPELVFNPINIKLSPKARKLYEKMEEDALLEFEAGDVAAASAAAVSTKLLQIANGAVYNENHDIQPIHKAKLEALERVINEAAGKSVLVFYNYKHDREMIERYFKNKVKLDHIKNKDAKARWNKGKTQVLLAHPASAGHGLNLQAGGHIMAWFGLTYNLEHWQQAIARLYRQGQQHTTVAHLLMIENSFEQKVEAKLMRKERTQKSLINALKARKESGTWN